MMIKLLLAKTFLTFLVFMVPYVIYISGKKVADVPQWARLVGLFLFGGASLTAFLAILIAIWD